jgi:LPS-assembly protein
MTAKVLARCVAGVIWVAIVTSQPTASAADQVCPQPPQRTVDANDDSTPSANGDSNTSDSIQITSDDADLSLEGDAKLSGNVLVRQGDRRIRADDVRYDAATQRFNVDGAVQYEDSLVRATGSSGTYSQTLGATFEGAEFELFERNARGRAKSMQLDANGRLDFEGVSFTSCPAEDPAWEISAGELRLDSRTRNGTGRRAKIEFQGVPLLYTPWISFPLGDQRKSGFLFPDVGASSRSGAQVSVPYYWNIAPNMDFTGSPVFYAKRGIDLGGEFRYLTSRQRGSIDFNLLPSDRVADADRSRVRWQHEAKLPGSWQFRADAMNVSDDNYFEDFAQGTQGTSVPFVERFAELAYRDLNWTLRAQVQNYQVLDAALAPEDRPYTRAPRLVANGDWTLPGDSRFAYGFDSELVRFDRNTGVTGWRIDAAPRVGFDWSGPGYFVRPLAGYRYTAYSLDDTAPLADDSPDRSLPFATLDAGVVLERPSGSRGQRRVTLEPRALYLYTPFREQSDLPVFDTTVPDLNTVQLFRTSRYVGADRVSDANQLSVGVTSRLFDTASGAQFIALTVGQAFYFEQPRVALPNETAVNRNRSDFVAQLALTAYQDWNVEAALQYNTEESQTERSQFLLQYRPGNDRVVNLAYRSQRDRFEQAEISGAWPIGPRWSAFARIVYSLREEEGLDQFAGFEYRSCCWSVRAVARKFLSSRTGEQDTGVFLQLELNGLASVGTPADAFLASSIRGYSPVRRRR